MRTARCLGCLLSVVLFSLSYGFAQSNPNEEQGLKPYESWHGGDLDSVVLTNGALALHIPLVSFPQRGNLDLSFSLFFSSKQWTVVSKCNSQGLQCVSHWQPVPRGGAMPIVTNPDLNLSLTGAYVASSLDWWLQSAASANIDDPWCARSLVSPDGNVHQLGKYFGGAGENCLIFPTRSLDATGILHSDANTVIMPNGVRFSYPSIPLHTGGQEPSTVTDADGNQIVISSSGWTDTIGRVIPGSALGTTEVQPGVPTSDLSTCPAGTTSASIWNVPGLAGVNNGIRTFKLCYAPFTISTNFQATGVTEYGPTSTALLAAIVLPDLTMWTLSYDGYGDINRIGFPTGGSISYTYAADGFGCGYGPQSLSVTSRTVDANDGTGGHQFTYTYANGKTTVTSPDGNDTVHTISYSVVPSSGCEPAYDTQVQYYQGSAAGGTLLKTVATLYQGSQNPADSTAINIVPTQTTTTLPGGQTSRAVVTYDSGNTFSEWFVNGYVTVPVVLGSILQKDEYDFSNTLVRSTVNHYLWQDNAAYLTNNLVGLAVSTTLKDGSGNQAAKTTYGYDETAPTPSGIVTSSLVAPPAGGNIRGKRTTTSHLLDTSNSFLSSTATYFDTGMPASSTPPANADGLNRTTTYTYSATFLGAYVTQTNMPDTQMPDPGATVVPHVISGNYDLNTGLLTSFTDENSQTYTYQYDPLMLRLTQGNHPDGGQTLFNYPDPNTVQRQRLIAGTTYDSYTAKFDGLGRSYETLAVTPSGTVEVDTVYDSQGRVSTVSNPYYQGTSHSSDPTYGVTQSQYDALSRVTKTIKQDGSSSSVQYNAPAGDGQGSSVVCTTAIDEVGKPRQVCSDALGRMVKVLEPNPGAAATNATGWVTVSGTEQTANSQPATSGSATITITGTEQGVCTHMVAGRCNATLWDTGKVSVTVANFPIKTVNYGQGDTDATVAWKVSCAFHQDTSSAADASCPVSAGTSTQVVLTARAAGASSNYSFTTSSTTNDTGCINFCGPSFFAAPASGAFTGGQNASSTPDTGSVTVTVNGTGYQTSFGAGDTSSTIAGRLAGIISGGSYTNAVASGSTINLTSKTAGTAGDYTLSASYTWNSGQFTNPSFTTSASGPSLTGALDASALNNNPYVTTYQYNTRGDMLCVHQKATDTTADVACTGTTPPSVPAAWRQRFFTYDSFSRLLTAQNPETSNGGNAQITYGYDADSNLTSKTDPAPNQAWGSSPVQTVTIGYTYDALNRLLNTTFSDGVTPNTAHRYDYASYLGQTFAYPIGREVAATAANNTIAAFTSYDKMGRVAQTVECTPGVANCQTFTATYGPVGQVLTLGYPGNGFSVTYGYDGVARLTTATDSNGVIYAQTPTFLASGAIQEFTAPNFNGNKYHVDYNNRLQPTEIWTGSAKATALFDKTYGYNPPSTTQMNNGNIYNVTNVIDGTRTQTFAYDPLNRLTSAGDAAHWANTYTYDPWGNLYQKNPGSSPGENMVKVADANNHLSGLTYDAAGNEINDGLGGTMVYDAENRITTTAGVTYTYDADGRRVKKSTGTNYWYGPSGGVLAETDSGGNWTNYVFFGGQRLARNVSGDIKYYITDHLHSTAMFVDKAGTTAAILDDNDFYPWGGVVPGLGKSTSNNTVKFTGQYRDTESQLDYFGARYYANVTGRFMSPDWDGKPTTVPYADFGDPQSLNLYSYVRNSPIVRVDAHGHDFNYYPGAWARTDSYICHTCDSGTPDPAPGSSGKKSTKQTVTVSNPTPNPTAEQVTNWLRLVAVIVEVPADLLIATAITESALNAGVVNTNDDGSKDYGVMQVNDKRIGEQVSIGGAKIEITKDIENPSKWQYNALIGAAELKKEYDSAVKENPRGSKEDIARQSYAGYNHGHGNRDWWFKDPKSNPRLADYLRDDTRFLQVYQEQNKQ
jgi:RHS repeat-associated protein